MHVASDLIWVFGIEGRNRWWPTLNRCSRSVDVVTAHQFITVGTPLRTDLIVQARNIATFFCAQQQTCGVQRTCAHEEIVTLNYVLTGDFAFFVQHVAGNAIATATVGVNIGHKMLRTNGDVTCRFGIDQIVAVESVFRAAVAAEYVFADRGIPWFGAVKFFADDIPVKADVATHNFKASVFCALDKLTLGCVIRVIQYIVRNRTATDAIEHARIIDLIHVGVGQHGQRIFEGFSFRLQQYTTVYNRAAA